MIAERVAAVRVRIARAAERAGRRPEDITLVAVSKTHPPEAVREAFESGIRDFGENRVQEGERKAGSLADLRPAGMRWHLVGHLQGNKARRAVALFDCVHSVDDAQIGLRLGRAAGEEGRRLAVLVQVDLGRETTKFGVPEQELMATLAQLRPEPGIALQGLMVLPPYQDEPEDARPYFRRLRELRDEAASRGLVEGACLSMGMSHDFEVAIEEGATHVRVGTALFGARLAMTEG